MTGRSKRRDGLAPRKKKHSELEVGEVRQGQAQGGKPRTDTAKLAHTQGWKRWRLGNGLENERGMPGNGSQAAWSCAFKGALGAEGEKGLKEQ